MERVRVIDVGCGNLLSIIRIFEELDRDVKLIKSPDDICDGDTIVLPGIGSYDKFIQGLKKYDFYDFLKCQKNLSSIKLVGICLGMQVLGDSSEEGFERGLGLIAGKVRKIPAGDRRVPNIGWHYVVNKKTHYSTQHFDENERFYFCHSFYFDCEKENILSTIEYNAEVAAAVTNLDGNVFGFQFHPEKSHKFGLKLMGAL